MPLVLRFALIVYLMLLKCQGMCIYKSGDIGEKK